MTDASGNNNRVSQSAEQMQMTAKTNEGSQPPRKSSRMTFNVEPYQAGNGEMEKFRENQENEINLEDVTVTDLNLPVSEFEKEADAVNKNQGQAMTKTLEPEEPANLANQGQQGQQLQSGQQSNSDITTSTTTPEDQPQQALHQLPVDLVPSKYDKDSLIESRLMDDFHMKLVHPKSDVFLDMDHSFDHLFDQARCDHQINIQFRTMLQNWDDVSTLTFGDKPKTIRYLRHRLDPRMSRSSPKNKNFREYGLLIYERTVDDDKGKLLQSESYIRGIEFQALVTNGVLHRFCGLRWVDFSEKRLQQMLPRIRQYFAHPCNASVSAGQELCSDGQSRSVYYNMLHEWEEGYMPKEPID